MTSSFWVALIMAGIGLSIVILPDKGEPVTRFNEDHGPSLQDLVGLIMILLAWVFMVVKSVVERNRIVQAIGKRRVRELVAFLVLGGAAITLGLQVEKDLILWGGVVISTVAYMILFIPAFRNSQ